MQLIFQLGSGTRSNKYQSYILQGVVDKDKELGVKYNNAIKRVITNVIIEKMTFEHRLLCSRHLEPSAH